MTTQQSTKLQQAKAAIKAEGWKFYCDKTKSGWSLKVATLMMTPIADEEMSSKLYYLLAGLADKVVVRNAITRDDTRMFGQVVTLRGSKWTRFHFNK